MWTSKNYGYKIDRLLTSNLPLLVRGQGRAVLIDSCRQKAWHTFKKKLDRILCDQALDYLILTHEHDDHIETVKDLVETYGCQVIMHRETLSSLRDLDAFDYRLVDDQLSLDELGLNGQVLWTPGHSHGSISIIIDQVIFLGDLLGEFITKGFAKKVKRVNDDVLESVNRLLSYKGQYYFTSHKKTVLSHDDLGLLVYRYGIGDRIDNLEDLKD